MPKTTLDDPHFVFVPVAEAIIPPPGMIVHEHQKWWIYHPDKGIAYWKHSPKKSYTSALCNSNKEITERLIEIMYPWATAYFMESVFRKIDLADYR